MIKKLKLMLIFTLAAFGSSFMFFINSLDKGSTPRIIFGAVGCAGFLFLAIALLRQINKHTKNNIPL